MSDTTRNKQNLIEMFADNTAGESYCDNRLITQRLDGGNLALIAYGWLKIAEYNERRDTITLFEGHRALQSSTVSCYINDVKRYVGERRNIVVTGESPIVGRRNKGAKYIGHYIDFSGGLSAVEKEAYDLVRKSLEYLDN